MAPGLIAFTIFVIVPAIGGLALSFFDWNLFNDPTFVGLSNVERLFTDASMWQSLWVSLMFVVLGVVPATVLGFVLAVIAGSSLPGAGAIRVLYFAPMVASSAVAAVLWTNIYQARFGIINQLLALVGISGPNWLSDPTLARPALVVVLIWSSLPLVIILYIAAIQKVPDDLYAAAAMDGAGRWRQLWSITWPSVMPTTLVILVLMFLTFLGGTLEFALLMTDGGPLGQTTSLALYAYKQAFQLHDLGYASALSLFQLVLIIVVFALYRGSRAVWRRAR
jgi:multiple sugar transport system permease protein